MRATPFKSILKLLTLAGCLLLLSSCRQQSSMPPRTVTLYQQWQLQPGSTIAGYRITNGLGDIGIILNGQSIYAPFAGQVQPHQEHCVLFSSAQVPAYLFRLCGLTRSNLGQIQAGEAIGSGNSLQFAALRKQPNGTWAFVEPSRQFLEQLLHEP